MKKILILLFLIPFFCSAKFHKASISFNNGTMKNGFIELPDYPDDLKIKFRLEEKGKTEKYSIDDVSKFEIINDKNEVVKYVALKLANQNGFNLKIKSGYKKVWAKIIKESKISIYAGFYAYNPSNGTGGGGTFYIKRENEDFALYLDEFGGEGFSVCVNCFDNLKKTIKSYFENSCSKLHQLITKEELKKKGIAVIVDLYEQNCGLKTN